MTKLSEAEALQRELTSAREHLLEARRAFAAGIAEARRHHYEISTIESDMSVLNRRLDAAGHIDLCISPSTAMVGPIEVTHPTIINKSAREIGRVLELIAKGESTKIDGKAWRAKFFPNSPARQSERQARGR